MKIRLNSGITAGIYAYSTYKAYFTKLKQFQALLYHDSDQKWIESARDLTESFGLEFFIFVSLVFFSEKTTKKFSFSRKFSEKTCKIL